MRYQFRPLGRWTGPETSPRRSSAAFRATWPGTVALLGDELGHLGAAEPAVLQVDVDEADLRLDGMIRANARPRHPGAVISFESRFGPLRYATDAYEQQWAGAMPGYQANVRAIALALTALRAVDRYGVTRRGEQYTGWKALEAPALSLFADAGEARDWMRAYAVEIGVSDPSRDWTGDWQGLYRRMARVMHPDRGHPRADWDRLDAARQLLKKEGWL